MNRFFLNQSFSTVHTLTLVASLWSAFFWAAPSLAQTPTVISAGCSSAPEPKGSCPGGESYKPITTSCPSGGVYVERWECQPDPTSCDTFKSEVAEAQTKASNACAQAGLGSFPSCLSKMKECMETSTVEGTESGIMDQILPFAGQLSQTFIGADLTAGFKGSATNQPVGKCPNMSARDYFDQKDRITREINNKNKEIADLQKEIADATKDFNEAKADAMKESQEAQKELNERLRNISESQRQTNAELLKTQSEIAEKVRQLNSEIMAKRAQMNRTESNFVRQLGQMTNKLAQSNCMLEVRKLRAELNKAGAYSTNAGGVGAMGQQNALKKVLEEKFQNCIKDFNLQRQAIQEDRANALKLAQNEIANLQENINEANQALESVGQQIQQQLQALEKEKETATQEAVARSQAAQQAMTDAFTVLQERQKTIASQQATLTAEINGLNQDLAKLGPQPAAGSTNGWREAQNALIEYRAKVVTVPEACQKAAGVSSSDKRALDRLLEGKK